MAKYTITILFAIGLFDLSFAQDKNNVNEDQLLKSVYFGGGSYIIDEQQKAELVEFIFDVDNIENYEIIISGHTDNIGGKEYNEWLSEMRSMEVKNILIDSDIPKHIIHLRKFGQDNPLYNNRSFSGRNANRRVDVFVIPITF